MIKSPAKLWICLMTRGGRLWDQHDVFTPSYRFAIGLIVGLVLKDEAHCSTLGVPDYKRYDLGTAQRRRRRHNVSWKGQWQAFYPLWPLIGIDSVFCSDLGRWKNSILLGQDVGMSSRLKCSQHCRMSNLVLGISNHSQANNQVRVRGRF